LASTATPNSTHAPTRLWRLAFGQPTKLYNLLSDSNPLNLIDYQWNKSRIDGLLVDEVPSNLFADGTGHVGVSAPLLAALEAGGAHHQMRTRLVDDFSLLAEANLALLIGALFIAVELTFLG
jgi:hypothetical protein